MCYKCIRDLVWMSMEGTCYFAEQNGTSAEYSARFFDVERPIIITRISIFTLTIDCNCADLSYSSRLAIYYYRSWHSY